MDRSPVGRDNHPEERPRGAVQKGARKGGAAPAGQGGAPAGKGGAPARQGGAHQEPGDLRMPDVAYITPADVNRLMRQLWISPPAPSPSSRFREVETYTLAGSDVEVPKKEYIKVLENIPDMVKFTKKLARLVFEGLDFADFNPFKKHLNKPRLDPDKVEAIVGDVMMRFPRTTREEVREIIGEMCRAAAAKKKRNE